MTGTRRKHFAVESLSEEGQAVVRRGLEANRPYERIVEEILAETGEKISLNALFNWKKWQVVQGRIEQYQAELQTAETLIKAVGDPRVLAAINQAIKHRVLEREEQLEALSTEDLLEHMRAMERLEIEHRRLDIDGERLKTERIKAAAAEKNAEAALTMADAALKRAELAERKLREAATKLQEAEGKVREGRALTVDELANIREQVFGLVEQAEQPEGGDAA